MLDDWSNFVNQGLKYCTEHDQCLDYNNRMSKMPDLRLSMEMVDRIHGEDELTGLVPRSNRNVKVNLKSSLEGSYVDHVTTNHNQSNGSKSRELDMFEVNSLS